MSMHEDEDSVSKLGLTAIVFFGLCLVAFGVMLVRGAQAPELHSSDATVTALVERKPLMTHMKSPEVIELLRASNDSVAATNTTKQLDVRVLTRRLNLKPIAGDSSIRLRATGVSPEHARTLLDTWLQVSRDSWQESVEQTHPIYGPFLIGSRTLPE